MEVARRVVTMAEDKHPGRVGPDRDARDAEAIACRCGRFFPAPRTGWDAPTGIVDELGTGFFGEGTEQGMGGLGVFRGTGMHAVIASEALDDRAGVDAERGRESTQHFE